MGNHSVGVLGALLGFGMADIGIVDKLRVCLRGVIENC